MFQQSNSDHTAISRLRIHKQYLTIGNSPTHYLPFRKPQGNTLNSEKTSLITAIFRFFSVWLPHKFSNRTQMPASSIRWYQIIKLCVCSKVPLSKLGGTGGQNEFLVRDCIWQNEIPLLSCLTAFPSKKAMMTLDFEEKAFLEYSRKVKNQI